MTTREILLIVMFCLAGLVISLVRKEIKRKKNFELYDKCARMVERLTAQLPAAEEQLRALKLICSQSNWWAEQKCLEGVEIYKIKTKLADLEFQCLGYKVKQTEEDLIDFEQHLSNCMRVIPMIQDKIKKINQARDSVRAFQEPFRTALKRLDYLAMQQSAGARVLAELKDIRANLNELTAEYAKESLGSLKEPVDWCGIYERMKLLQSRISHLEEVCFRSTRPVVRRSFEAMKA